MGQKVNPIGFRVSVNKDWSSSWFDKKKNYADNISEDIKIRKYLNEKLKNCALGKILIERYGEKIRIVLYSAKPGLIIGRKGKDIEELKKDMCKKFAGNNRTIIIDTVEIKNPELNASLTAQSIAIQLEKRIAFRRAMKKAIQLGMDLGAKGIKVKCSGRLGGADLARSEAYSEGKVPLHTLRADVDYGFSEAYTPAGIIGIKVWICKSSGLED